MSSWKISHSIGLVALAIAVFASAPVHALSYRAAIGANLMSDAFQAQAIDNPLVGAITLAGTSGFLNISLPPNYTSNLNYTANGGPITSVSQNGSGANNIGGSSATKTGGTTANASLATLFTDNTFSIITNTGTMSGTYSTNDTGSGSFNLSGSGTYTVGTDTRNITFSMGWFQDLTDPNHMTLSYLDATASAVPEPTTALELAGGLALLARRRKA